MTEASNHSLDRNLSHLPPAAGRLGAVFARPKRLAVLCIFLLTGLGWLYLGLLTAGMGGSLAVLGPGMAALDLLPRTIAVLCSPTFGMALMPGGVWGLTGFALIGLMWAAMIFAMMLPSAAPMIFTYAEIADTAAHKGEPVVTPFMLALGYTVIWLGFALAATIAQFALTQASLLDPGMASVSGLFSGAIFIAAGFYQFSALKLACLKQCQSPFPFFFANWATTPQGVFRLGLQQGMFCLGCCWAMMAVMFAVGVMNVVWMAALGVVMTIEKIGHGRRFTYAIGVVSIAAGLAFVGSAVWQHWPGQAI
jgi:predicted metal-binding membrane protein